MKSYLSIILLALSGMFISCKDDLELQNSKSQTPISFKIVEDVVTSAAMS